MGCGATSSEDWAELFFHLVPVAALLPALVALTLLAIVLVAVHAYALLAVDRIGWRARLLTRGPGASSSSDR